MAKKGKWACASHDKVRHFYVAYDDFYSRLCDYPHVRLLKITKSEKVPKCPECIECEKSCR